MHLTCPLSLGGATTNSSHRQAPALGVEGVDVTAITTPCIRVRYVYEFYLQYNLSRGLHRHKEAFAPRPKARQPFCLFLRRQGRGVFSYRTLLSALVML